MQIISITKIASTLAIGQIYSLIVQPNMADFPSLLRDICLFLDESVLTIYYFYKVKVFN